MQNNPFRQISIKSWSNHCPVNNDSILQKIKIIFMFCASILIVSGNAIEDNVVDTNYNVDFNTDDRDSVATDKLTTHVLNEVPSHRWTLNMILLRYSIDSNAIKSSVVTK